MRWNWVSKTTDGVGNNNRPKAKKTRLGTHPDSDLAAALIPSGCGASNSVAEMVQRQEPDIQAAEVRPNIAEKRLSTIPEKEGGQVDRHWNKSYPRGQVVPMAGRLHRSPLTKKGRTKRPQLEGTAAVATTIRPAVAANEAGYWKAASDLA